MDRRSFFSSSLAGAVSAPLASSQTARSATQGGFPDIIRPPDVVAVRLGKTLTNLDRRGTRWKGMDVTIITEPRGSAKTLELPIAVSAPETPLEHILLRWRSRLPQHARFLADHWERSYGDLEWRCTVGNRVMPWYFLATDGPHTYGYGVQTGASAICFWQADTEGVSLWLDLRSGSGPVHLGPRELDAAVVVSYSSTPGQGPFAAACAFCRRLSPEPRLPEAPVYGGNNWYYTYGQNFGAADILRDSELLAELAPGGGNRPFMVIDMGWSEARNGAGPVARTKASFPDMDGLAGKMKEAGVRPAIWTRPLLTVEQLPETWRLKGSEARVKVPFFILDPSVPEVLRHVAASIRTLHDWGFELIKHDFSTYDILGRWGFEMGVMLTPSGWRFDDNTRTTAEIVSALYRAIREAAGESLLIGCNTIGHLGAGLFELQRIGDDTSGREWERTRKMGVNTLAFRLPQHNRFFSADADCVPITAAIPWRMTRQWLDLVARSGTPLFVSADPSVIGAEQKGALKRAFALAAKPQPPAEPLDWLDTTAPRRWRFGNQRAAYNWDPGDGASPFST